jgi:MoxR-like ATPase
MLQAIVNIVQATRVDANLQLGASTRAALMLSKVLKAWALIQGRDFATEDDLKYLAPFVLLHRLRFKPGVSDTATALQRIVEPQLEKLIGKAV